MLQVKSHLKKTLLLLRQFGAEKKLKLPASLDPLSRKNKRVNYLFHLFRAPNSVQFAPQSHAPFAATSVRAKCNFWLPNCRAKLSLRWQPPDATSAKAEAQRTRSWKPLKLCWQPKRSPHQWLLMRGLLSAAEIASITMYNGSCSRWLQASACGIYLFNLTPADLQFDL